MFVVLRVNSPPKGVFIKSKMKKMVTDACIQTVSTENGLPFYVLDVPEGMNLSMWEPLKRNAADMLPVSLHLEASRCPIPVKSEDLYLAQHRPPSHSTPQ